MRFNIVQLSIKHIKIFTRLQVATFKEFIQDRGEGMAGALSYYQLLSIAPLCGFIIFLSTKIFGYEKSRDVVVPLLHLWFPDQFITLIKNFLKYVEHLDESSITTISWIAAVTLVIATKEYFAQLKDSIEIMWNDRREKFGLKPILYRTIEDYTFTVIPILIIFLVLSIRVILPFPFAEKFDSYSELEIVLIRFFRICYEFLILFCLSVFVFWKGPSYKVSFIDTIPAAILFSLLQVIGREIMKIHMSSLDYERNIELIIVMLAWIYYYNIVFIYCAQFSKCLIASKRTIDVQTLKYN